MRKLPAWILAIEKKKSSCIQKKKKQNKTKKNLNFIHFVGRTQFERIIFNTKLILKMLSLNGEERLHLFGPDASAPFALFSHASISMYIDPVDLVEVFSELQLLLTMSTENNGLGDTHDLYGNDLDEESEDFLEMLERRLELKLKHFQVIYEKQHSLAFCFHDTGCTVI
jgi:hypothetical protein